MNVGGDLQGPTVLTEYKGLRELGGYDYLQTRLTRILGDYPENRKNGY